MRTFQASEFKARCLGLLDEVAATGEPITITKRGRVVARLVPAVDDSARYPQLNLLGSVRVRGDVISPPVPESEVELDSDVL